MSGREQRESEADAHVAAAAAAWVVRRDRGLSAEERRAFEAWRRADVRHARELERIGGAWRGLDALTAVPELEALAEATVARARQRRARRGRFALATTALAAAAAVVLMFLSAPERGDGAGAVMENVQVLASTLRRMPLPDGSVAKLNGSSRVEVDFTPEARRIRLAEGEAHFVVEKDPSRPFFVTAGPVTVRAVGTAFNVRLAPDKVEVLVTEGRVKLEQAEPGVDVSITHVPKVVAPALTEGQRAVIPRNVAPRTEDVAIGEVGPAEIEAALGWQNTRLVFNNTPLDEVVEAFNRYNATRLVLGDPELRTRALTGVFRADNVDGFVRLLGASLDVKAETRSRAETVLLPVR